MTEYRYIHYHLSSSVDGEKAAQTLAKLYGDNAKVIPIVDNRDDPHLYEEYLKEVSFLHGEELTYETFPVFFDYSPSPEQIKSLSDAGYWVTVINHDKQAYEAMVASGMKFKPMEIGYLVGRQVSPDISGTCYIYSPNDSSLLMTECLCQEENRRHR